MPLSKIIVKEPYLLFFLMLFAVISSCSTNKLSVQNPTSIKIDTLFLDKISIRAILPARDKIWYGAENGRYGYVDLESLKRAEKKIDSVSTEFRSIAGNGDEVFILNAGAPAKMYRIGENFSAEMVYEETHPKVFYDSMIFWEEGDGIAIGDPTESCLSVIITTNGGRSWNKLPCKSLPEIIDGEAAFAASNTNVNVYKNHAWIVSGGKAARVFHSSSRGKSWRVYETPIIQGREMTGIFTSDFYDETIGVIAGGDYEKPEQNYLNKAITVDGGKTWKLIAENSGFGYASCIRFVPGSKGRKIVCVGATGVWLSADQGNSWKQLSTDQTLYTIRFADKNTAYAAGRNKLIRIRFNF